MRWFALAVIAGCGSAPPAAAPINNASVEPAKPTLALRMTRTECLGGCAAYTVTIMSDGTVTWHGESNVAVIGDRTTRVGRSDVDRMVAAFDHAGIFKFEKPPRFTTQNVNGRMMTVICDATDQPTTIVSIPHDGTLHRSEYQEGCNDALEAAEQLVDNVVRPWIVR